VQPQDNGSGRVTGKSQKLSPPLTFLKGFHEGTGLLFLSLNGAGEGSLPDESRDQPFDPDGDQRGFRTNSIAFPRYMLATTPQNI
jgi:hypothetical protein